MCFLSSRNKIKTSSSKKNTYLTGTDRIWLDLTGSDRIWLELTGLDRNLTESDRIWPNLTGSDPIWRCSAGWPCWATPPSPWWPLSPSSADIPSQPCTSVQCTVYSTPGLRNKESFDICFVGFLFSIIYHTFYLIKSSKLQFPECCIVVYVAQD